MAFVLVQHLEARHESMLTDLLSKATRMPVTEVRRETRVEPNHLYVIRANTDLSLVGSVLRVAGRKAPAGHHLPIDHFFRSLAEIQGARAIGVVLSGTASDGTLGLKAIKVAGGITFAQEPESAKFDGMPKSAIVAGCVDFVLPPARIAKELSHIVCHPYVGLSTLEKADPLFAEKGDEWNRLFKLLGDASGVDFTFYKKPTIKRRVARRMAVRKVERLAQYLKYLGSHRDELDDLYNDILILERIMEVDPATDVVLMTAHYSVESAVEAIKKGASDYLTKPVSIGSLRERIGKLVEEARKWQRSLQLEDELRTNSEFEGIVGRSPQMWEMFSRIRRVAPHYRSLLISGETGTGKDLVARAIHKLSPVAAGRYVVLNCSAVVETLFESELFGHVKGSFTGATHDKPGLFEHAHGGTLFLDEIGDMPFATQAKLLRVLQDQEVQRVGALSAHKVNVHVIAATNHNLRAAVAEKRFREDLYYRLSMVEIESPRLADRKEDLPLLERHFVARFAAQYGKEIRGLTHRAQIRLSQHSWPGNVRELENVIGHAAMMTMSNTIDVQDLPENLHTPSEHTEPRVAVPSSGIGTLEEQERLLLIRALEAAGAINPRRHGSCESDGMRFATG